MIIIFWFFGEKTNIKNPKQGTIYKNTNLSRFLIHVRQQFRSNKLDKQYEKKLKNAGIRLIPTKKIGSVNYYD